MKYSMTSNVIIDIHYVIINKLINDKECKLNTCINCPIWYHNTYNKIYNNVNETCNNIILDNSQLEMLRDEIRERRKI